MTPVNRDSPTTPGDARPGHHVIDDDKTTRRTMAASLRRRFGPDYEVIDPGGATAALSELERCAATAPKSP